MKAISTLCGIFLSFILFAQKPPIKFGKISEEELKMTVYEEDKSAAAVVLADYGESVINYNQTEGFQIEFERIRRIKILNKDGYDWANFEIPLYERNNNDEKLYGLKALTVNLEGNKAVETKLGKEGIFEEETSENWKKVKITLPNVREGSVIDITYKVISPYLFNFQDWEFQTSIPVKWSEYVARIPEYFEYQRYSQGYIPFKISDQNSVRKSMTLGITERSEGPGITDYPYKTTFRTETIEFNEITFRWVSENVPAFVVEPYMTTYRDYISKMNFELAQIKLPNRPVELVMGTWDNINKELLESPEFGGVVKRSNFLNKIVEEIISEKSSDVEKLAAIYSYVKSNVQWDGNYRKYTDGNFKRVLDDSKGNSAEINLMLVSMLQKAELRADPVVISTRNHGFIRQSFPISSQFNYVICAVENDRKLILLDATDRSLSANMLPERCLNGKGFLISENNARWVELTPTVKTKTILGAVLSFENEGQLKGHVEITKEGYDGQEIRAEYNALGEDSYVNKLAEKNNWTIQSHGFENLNNLNEPVKEIYDLTLNETLHTDILYFNPMAGTAITENPFKSETREYPVDFGKGFEQISVIKMKIPEGYEMEEFPTPLAITLPERGGRYIYNIANSK
ncbi:MAG: transglutaminase domain-containing protein [Cyclobacteriaceae bacterium]